MTVWALLLAVAASLPEPGTRFKELPAGKGRAQVEASCYTCHSADIIVQQRLTEKQWTAAVDKMVRWGSPLPAGDRGVVIAYLSRHFGPNNRFTPIVVKVVGKRRK